MTNLSFSEVQSMYQTTMDSNQLFNNLKGKTNGKRKFKEISRRTN